MKLLLVLGFLLSLFLVSCMGSAETEINFIFKDMVPSGSGGCGGNCPDDNDDGGNANDDGDCSFFDFTQWRNALSQIVCGKAWPCGANSPGSGNGGFNLNMWATVLNRAGRVCGAFHTGPKNTDQWGVSRVISAQKANTANGLGLTDFAISSANLYAATQPGGSLYGLQHSNPVDTEVAYGGLSANYGNRCGNDDEDPMCGQKIGGINVFGGGVALYGADGAVLGALGVSGDSSCADHNIAWKLRDQMGLDYVPAGPTPYYDNIWYPTDSASELPGFGHVICSAAAKAIGESLHSTHPVSVRASGRSRRSSL